MRVTSLVLVLNLSYGTPGSTTPKLKKKPVCDLNGTIYVLFWIFSHSSHPPKEFEQIRTFLLYDMIKYLNKIEEGRNRLTAQIEGFCSSS